MEENLTELALSSPHQLQAWFQSVEDQITALETRLEGYRHRFGELFEKEARGLSVDVQMAVEEAAVSPPLSPIPLSRKDYIKSNIEAVKWRKAGGVVLSKKKSPRLTPTKGLQD